MTISFASFAVDTAASATAGTNAYSIPHTALNDNVTMPVLGLGVAKLSDEQTEASILAALESGCRLIDTAASYGNEAVVGRAIKASGVPRSELFVTTKLGTSRQGYASTLDACRESIDRLGLDYLDMYLIHWPAPKVGKYLDSWQAMIHAREQGLVRSIGVCNFTEDLLTELIDETSVAPALNQVELHPLFNQERLRRFHAEQRIVTEAHSPLGFGERHIIVRVIDNPTVKAIGAKHDRSPAQVLIRWSLQLGNVVTPRSSRPHRIAENFDVFDFELSDDDMALLNGLHNGTRIHHHPMTFLGT
ncbi:2,5-didehydrogluconate reductase A [Mycolicibacter algericus DSM 45454]|uniref:2,5-didehydrogluconate reductase A n=3 Tax=Mycobacteriaceae TaxID=1762 RepID=A0ABX3RXG5_MYCAL|nr:2,5-didehydrogluconate reductase A [Mycolicibacter algericus DSM 45454]GFG87525.1 putative oxidoreductase [Mycolicibacter algericus]